MISFLGTKSNPDFPPSIFIGWHLHILLRPRYDPLIIPKFFKQSMKYSEQFGKNLQLFPKTGEIKYL